MNELRIVHIIPNLKKGGAERICIDICNQLVSVGKEVLLVLLDNSIEYNHLSKKVNLYISKDLSQIDLKNPSSKAFKRLCREINNFKPDVIHTHLYLAELIASLIAINVPRFTHVHDNMRQLKKLSINDLYSKQGLIRIYEKSLYKRNCLKHPTTYLTISKDAQDYISTNLRNSSPILLPNAINRNRFKIKKKDYQKDILNLISIGSFQHKKGHALLIHCISELKKISPSKHLHLTILGEGLLRGDLENLVSELNLNQHVSLPGNVSNPEDYLNDSNLYIHGASYEPFGLVLIEAMSCGLPVISTDGKGNRDFMDGSNGILLNHRDPKKFAQEIYDLMNDEARYKKLQKGALETAKKYDIVNYVDRLVEIYKESIHEA